MLNAIVCLSVLAVAQGNDRVEYTFKSSLARFKATQWDLMVKAQSPDILVVSNAAGIPNGNWIFFDFAKNKVIVGNKDHFGEDLINYLQQFDIIPKQINIPFTFSQPDRGFEMKGTLQALNNQACSIGSPETPCLVTLRPRINDDGTVTMQVVLKVEKQSVTTDVRLRSGERLLLDNGQWGVSAQGGRVIPAVQLNGPKSEYWKPYRLDIKPEIVK